MAVVEQLGRHDSVRALQHLAQGGGWRVALDVLGRQHAVMREEQPDRLGHAQLLLEGGALAAVSAAADGIRRQRLAYVLVVCLVPLPQRHVGVGGLACLGRARCMAVWVDAYSSPRSPRCFVDPPRVAVGRCPQEESAGNAKTLGYAPYLHQVSTERMTHVTLFSPCISHHRRSKVTH